MKQLIPLLVCLLVLAGPSLARSGDPAFVTGDTRMTYRNHGSKWCLVEIVQEKGKKSHSESILLLPSQIVELQQAYKQCLPVKKGGPDQRLQLRGNLGKNSATLTMTCYGSHRTRAFQFQIEGKHGKSTYLTLSRSKAEVERFSRFLKEMGLK